MIKRYLSLTSFENALHLLKTTFPSPERTETVPLEHSLGRVIASPVYAPYTVPEVNLAAMDGIAVKSQDTFEAKDQSPVRIADFARVNTGNVIPPGYDAVVMIEDTWQDGNAFQVRKAAARNQHIRQAGEDIRQGRLVLPKGHVVRAFDIGALATYGITRLEVRTANVGIIPTGSELVPLGNRPAPGQVVESNTIMAQVYLESMGAHCTRLPIVCDDRDLIRNELKSAVENNDMVVISAGSSAGTRDYTAEVISSLGTLLFHGVAVKPGKPMMLGVIDKKPVIGLPGYPLAAQTVLREFAAPLLEEWGLAPARKYRVPVRLSTPVSSDLGFDEFLPVSVGRIGKQYWGMAQSRGPVVQMATVRANGYAHIPATSEGYDAGQELDIFLTTDPANISRSLLLSGVIDPALEELANLARDEGIYIHAANTGNTGAVLALKRNSCHAAPMTVTDTSRLCECGTAPSYQGMQDLAFVHIAGIDLGIVSKEPVALDSLDRLRWINTRRDFPGHAVFDALLTSLNLDPTAISGYTLEAGSGSAVADAVFSGHADAGICDRGTAASRNLCFSPIALERYELVLHRDMLDDPWIIQLIAILKKTEFRDALSHRGTYTTTESGKIRCTTPDTTAAKRLQAGSTTGLS
ncbi:MAG: molybdopterin biosynthesis protein [Methanoregula sp.]|nr:molybdopterin biosynthesis protein [Methanoregula sp.]